MIHLGLRQFCCDLASLLYLSWQIQILRGEKRSRLPYIFQTDNNLSVFKSKVPHFNVWSWNSQGLLYQCLYLGIRSRFVVGLLHDLQCLNAFGPRSFPEQISILALPAMPDSSQWNLWAIGALLTPLHTKVHLFATILRFQMTPVHYCPHGNAVLTLEYQRLFSHKTGRAVGIPHTRKLLFTTCQKEVEA